LLLVEDDDLAAERIFEMLEGPRATRFEITHVAGVDEALNHLQHGGFDVVLMDLSIQDAYALDSLLRAKVAARSVPIVVLVYQNDEDLALRAVRAGAQDYVIKGEASAPLLSRTLLHAVERHTMLRELRAAEQLQQYMASHDTLTGLPNRGSFIETLSGALEDPDCERLAVVFFDLDGFKAINDNLGHAMGDELLNDVAGRLRRTVGRSDSVARLGGDEFVAMLPVVQGPEAVREVTEKIRREIEKTYHVSGLECWVSCSIGIAMYPDDGSDPDELIKRADTAMYHAKSHGRNQVSFFQTTMTDKAAERFQLVNGLREAIHSGDLVLQFQPQVDMIREKIIAAETLVRWRHPERGLVSPSEFIPVAEETGLMVELGEWVLLNACRAAASWPDPELQVAVNVSGRQIDRQDFPVQVERVLRETGLAPGRLELELTESLAADGSVVPALSRLREAGVRIAIDDFGTGYSSFTLLKVLPVDVLKIDQSFVRGAEAGGPDEVILGGIIQMVHSLGIGVIAEGVETQEELNLLYRLGCTHVQGYLLSKPLGARDLEEQISSSDAPWRELVAALRD
jgi:diguanylate cyclase (GGDEF)-like protein